MVLLCLLVGALFATNAAHADEDGLLDPSDAFRLAIKEMPGAVRVDVRIADGYYVYRERFGFTANNTQTHLGTAQIPKGIVHFDQVFNKNVETYRHDVAAVVPVTSNQGAFELTVAYQGCSDKGVCYPPMTRTFKIDGAALQAASVATSSGAVSGATNSAASGAGSSLNGNDANTTVFGADRLYSQSYASSVLEGRSLPAVLGIFFVLGMALSLLPCSLPMIPILSSIILGEGTALTRRRGFALSLAYVLGMAIIYTVFGVAAALAGQGIGAALQNPWVLGAFGILLVAFALSLLGCYELQAPSSWQSRVSSVSQRLPGGKILAVFLMGALSALVVGACMTAPLFGVLAFIAQTGNVLLGGASLFAMALGIGVPLLVVGVGAGTVLPRAGAWMNDVKRAFGVMLLGAAVWIVAPVLPSGLNLLLWALVALLAAFGLGTFRATIPPGSVHTAWRWIGQSVGAAAALFAVTLVVGAAAGSQDPLHPLAVFASRGTTAQMASNAAQADPSAGFNFAPVRNAAQLTAATTPVGNGGRPSMLVFRADWCTSCLEMEHTVFPDPTVASQMRQFSLLHADVTANDADDQALMRRFGLFGPPAIIFFDAQGHELSALRVMGYLPADRFAKTLAAALNASQSSGSASDVAPVADSIAPRVALASVMAASNASATVSPVASSANAGRGRTAAILGAAIAAHAASNGIER